MLTMEDEKLSFAVSLFDLCYSTFNTSANASTNTSTSPPNITAGNDSESLSEQINFYQSRLNFYITGVCLLVICVLGIVFNILVMIVLTHKSMKRSSTIVYLFALALSDSLVLLCVITWFCLPTLSDVFAILVLPYIRVYVYPLALTAQTFTIWITVSVTVERYIAITHPLQASHMCTVKRARLTIAAVTVLSILFNITRWFETRTSLYLNHEYRMIYHGGLYLTFMCVVPIVLLSVLNYLLIRSVSKSKKKRRSMATSRAIEEKETNITLMLVMLVIVFILCQVRLLVN